MSAAAEDATATVGLIDHVTNVSDFIWGGTWNGEAVLPLPPMVVILFGIGLYFMIGLKFYPITRLGSAFAGLFRKSADKADKVTSGAAGAAGSADGSSSNGSSSDSKGSSAKTPATASSTAA